MCCVYMNNKHVKEVQRVVGDKARMILYYHFYCLILLLILLIYLGMCNSVLTHIHPHLSKLRLLLETSGSINEQCLQWVPCIPGITAQDFPLLGRNLPQGDQEGLIECPLFLRWYQEEGSQHSSRSPGGPKVIQKVLVAQHT